MIFWDFGSVQDLSLMEAIVLGGTAYPLDGGDPYEVDLSAIPQPFVIPIGEEIPGGYRYVPLFALCEGLGADCQWDESAGVAVATFRDITLTFTLDSRTVQTDGQWPWDIPEMLVAPVYRDGELWVDGQRQFLVAWSVNLDAAYEDDAPREMKMVSPYLIFGSSSRNGKTALGNNNIGIVQPAFQTVEKRVVLFSNSTNTFPVSLQEAEERTPAPSHS